MITQTDVPSSSSSWSSASPRWTYDVFLSFRGEDIRRNIIDHLYTSLSQKGLLTFRDDEQLEREKPISPELLKAIEGSRYVIVILSRNYAHSTQCLDELAKSVECMKLTGQTILPVYYDVDPSEVQNQTGNFGKAFSQHEEVFRDNGEKVQRWRAALHDAANVSRWYLEDGYVSKLTEEVIEKILTEFNETISSVTKDLVGIEYHVKEMHSYLEIGLQDVRIVGIWGTGGIGKTTIAQVVSERIRAKFEGYSFLANVKEVTEKHGLICLQKKLLSNLLGISVNIQNIDMGTNVLRHDLRTKMVLIVLDDVDTLTQLEALCDWSWFGSGSRIIVTSRDEILLRTCGVDKIYKVKGLTENEALQLFSQKAFKTDQAGEDFVELSKKFVKCAGGIPLALNVLGSFLCDRNIKAWSSAFDRVNRYHVMEIMEVLKISFEGLEEREKNIFLVIACFFNGEDKDRVTKILESCGYCPSISIKVLIDKSLVSLVGRKLWMHDLIQKFGQHIVHIESPQEPGKRSRLWSPTDIIHVLVKNKGTDAVEGIDIALSWLYFLEPHIAPEAFSKMHNLRFLRIHGTALMFNCPEHFSNTLKYFEWSGYHRETLPQGFQPENLCELNLCHSRIEQLWNARKQFLDKLKFINVSYSQNLTRTPDLTGTPNLESLVFEGCTNLEEIHPSIAVLKRLILLNFKDCRSLKSLPNQIEMECLEILNFSGCSEIKKIPEFVGPMEHLLELSSDEAAIENLPSSIGRLTGLTLLSLRDCKNLKCLPSGIGKLKSLKRLNICGCSKLEKLPESLGKIDCLEELDACGTSISDLPSSIFLLENLKVLSLGGCKGMPRTIRASPLGLLLPAIKFGSHSLTKLNLSDCNLQEGMIPENLGCLSSLVSLNLSKNSFVSLPKSIKLLSKLHNLNLESCKSLKKFPNLSEKVNFGVGAEGGNSQEMLSSCFNFINCFQLFGNQGSSKIAFAMLRRFLKGRPYPGSRFEIIIPGNEISQWFKDQGAGPLVNIDVPQHWHNDKWIGYALCAVFVIRRYLPVPANQLGKWKYGTYSTAHGLRCEVKPKNLGTGVPVWCPYLGCSEELGHIESEHVWLCFVGGEYFGTAWQESCCALEFFFKSMGPGLEVKKCGVRLIYEQDLVGTNFGF